MRKLCPYSGLPWAYGVIVCQAEISDLLVCRIPPYPYLIPEQRNFRPSRCKRSVINTINPRGCRICGENDLFDELLFRCYAFYIEYMRAGSEFTWNGLLM